MAPKYKAFKSDLWYRNHPVQWLQKIPFRSMFSLLLSEDVRLFRTKHHQGIGKCLNSSGKRNTKMWDVFPRHTWQTDFFLSLFSLSSESVIQRDYTFLKTKKFPEHLQVFNLLFPLPLSWARRSCHLQVYNSFDVFTFSADLWKLSREYCSKSTANLQQGKKVPFLQSQPLNMCVMPNPCWSYKQPGSTSTCLPTN